LSQLTKTEPFSKDTFLQHFKLMQNSRNRYINIVGLYENRVVAFGTVMLTVTLDDGRVGKIENIVVSDKMRGKGLGKDVIVLLRKEALKFGARKLELICEDKNIEFYAKLGFFVKGTMMVAYTA
jgi:N-acetylglutamate synthase-like GNAT family acetyltransferase